MLPSSWHFDFVDAPFDCDAAPELTGIYPGPYRCFFEKYSEENMSQAVDFVREVVDEDGPYDCIMGFSQGASVAAAYIAEMQRGSMAVELPVKLAVFMCAALIPPKIATAVELVRTIGALGDMDVPTVHIVGQHDPCYPQSIQLINSCNQSTAQIIIHNGGHDIPRDMKNCGSMATGIERTARTATLAG